MLGIIAAFALQVRAAEFISTNVFQTATNEVSRNEQWISADLITLDGTHENDLFLLGGKSIVLNGAYEGNIWGLGGQSVFLGGRGERNIRLAGINVRIDGETDGNVMVMADTAVFGTNAVVSGNVMVLANTIVQEGIIQGDAKLYSSRILTFGGTIKGDTEAASREIIFMRNARLEGNLLYNSPKELVPAEGVVAGDLERKIIKSPPVFTTARFASMALWFVAALLVGIPFITLFPMSTAMSTQLIRKSPWKCLLIGFVAYWGMIVAWFTCITTVVGVPLGLLVFAAWGSLAYLGHIIVALSFGTLMLKSIGQSIGKVILSMVAGLLLLYLLAVIPSPLWLFQHIIAWFGMGALILAMIEKRRLIIQVPQQLKKAETLSNVHNTEDQP